MDYYSSSGSCIETVRALHQTIASLRTALEESRNEISDLKSRSSPFGPVGDTVKNLSIENHLLRDELLYGTNITNNNIINPELSETEPVDTIKVSTDSSKPFKSEKQLSKSKIVTFSNTFDGDNQVSSSNSLHIINLEKNNSKSRGLSKFKEEPIDPKTGIFCSKTNVGRHNFHIDDYSDDRTNLSRADINLDKAKHLGHVIEAAINKISEKRNKGTERKQSKGKRKLHSIFASNKSEVKSKLKSKDKEIKKLEDTLKSPKTYRVDTDKTSDLKITDETKIDHEEKPQEEPENTSCKGSKKQVEFSVKISKKPTKLINIDIQTKYKKNKYKSTVKMGDKEEHKPNEDNIVPPLDLGNLTDHETCDNIDGNDENDIEQEVDDIELIFTTDDTKETDFKEELVPIDTLLQCPLSDYDEKLSADASDRELEDDVFNDNYEPSQENNFPQAEVYNSKSDNSIHEEKSLKSYYSFQDSSFENKSLEKDESFDRFEEKVRIVETDISKIGIQDSEYNLGRRNTCPNPLQYRPIMHREALGRNARKNRPIVVHPNVRKDSEAQTNISAIPGSSWRSESSLAHKVKIGDNFTTLPSKFPHPGSRLQLSEKTVEARRILLSDIGFTSMVPELSRSADHLCPPNLARGTIPTSYGQFLRTTDLYSPAYTQNQKYLWTTATPSDKSNSQSRYSSQFISSPPTLTRRCSAPVSPSKRPMRTTSSRVRFANGSLPELRTDWTTVDSGESTDSLVEEAEHYLRRSIDCLAPCHNVCFKTDSSKTIRRASAPEPSRDNVPPQGWQPFLPRVPRDLHLDYWVKVITSEGRVRGGRVRYVGPLLNQAESYVGVQLSTPDGQSDGTYNNRRYFNCEPYHGLFIPFKKIIMGWRP